MIDQFLELLRSSKYVVALTGAGISTASGIPDFRSPTGLYSKYPENIFDIDYFFEDPKGFYEFCKEALIPMTKAEPNPAHFMLARLEEKGVLKAVITQNIDGLHQKAGNRKVIELHGTVFEYYCTRCFKKFEPSQIKEMLDSKEIPICSCSGLIRPNIVFFKEILPEKAINEAYLHASKCDLMIALGSSLVVYPAAQIPMVAKYAGAKLVIVNKGETGLDHLCDMKMHKDLSAFAQECFSAAPDLFN
ncbi:MAG: NAD-dependent protein deacylase [Pseudothermotoga sp.]